MKISFELKIYLTMLVLLSFLFIVLDTKEYHKNSLQESHSNQND